MHESSYTNKPANAYLLRHSRSSSNRKSDKILLLNFFSIDAPKVFYIFGKKKFFVSVKI